MLSKRATSQVRTKREHYIHPRSIHGCDRCRSTSTYKVRGNKAATPLFEVTLGTDVPSIRGWASRPQEVIAAGGSGCNGWQVAAVVLHLRPPSHTIHIRWPSHWQIGQPGSASPGQLSTNTAIAGVSRARCMAALTSFWLVPWIQRPRTVRTALYARASSLDRIL